MDLGDVLLSFLFALPWKLIGVVALICIVTGLWYRGDHYMKRAATMETALDASIEVSNANAEAARAYAAEVDRISAVRVRTVEVKNDIRAKSERRRSEIAATPPDRDGPLAPVLRDQLNRLPVATYPDAVRPATSASYSGGTSVADARTVSAGSASDAEGRSTGH